MLDTGFISLHRKILNWEWFGDSNTFKIFIYCLLRANFQEQKFMGQTIPRGSFVTSLENMAKDNNMSIQNVKTAINHLKLTSEITSKSTNKYRIINVVNYNVYQDTELSRQQAKQQAKQQTTNKQLTSNQQTTNNNIINNNKDNKENKVINIYSDFFPLDEKLNQTFKDYLEVRKKMKVANTERAIQLLINKLEPYDNDTKLKMVEEAITHSWKSVYPLKEEKQTTSSNPFFDILRKEGKME